MIGGSLLLYMVLILVAGVVVDLALLPIPYLFTWSYLAVAFAMSHELAGEVVRASALSAECDRMSVAGDPCSRTDSC